MKKIQKIKIISLLFTISALFILFFMHRTYAVLVAMDPLILYEDGKKINDNSVIIDYSHGKEVCFNGSIQLYQEYENDLIINLYKTSEPNLLNYSGERTKSLLGNQNCVQYIKINWESLWKQWLERKESASEKYKKEKNYYYRKRIDEEIEQTKLIVSPKITSNITEDLWDKRIILINEFDHTIPACQYSWEEYDAYLQNYIDNAIYYSRFTIPKAGHSEFLGTKNIKDDRIAGFARCFNVDIKTNEIKEIECGINKNIATVSEKNTKNLTMKIDKLEILVFFIILFISTVTVIIFFKIRKIK